MTTDLYTQVRDEYLALSQSPAWRMAFEIALGDWMRDIATYHQGPIQAIADRAVIRQLEKTRDTITKRFLLERIEEIRKERTFREDDVVRDRKGQFAPEGRRGSGPGPQQPGISRRQPSERAQRNAVLGEQRLAQLRQGQGAPAASRERETMEYLSRPIALDTAENPGDHKADVLNRMAAMTYALEEKTLSDKDRQRIQYTITGPKGTRVVTPSIGKLPDEVDYDGGERVQYMAPVGPDHPATVAGKVMDIGLVAGLDAERAAKAGSVVADIHDTLNTTDWGRRLTNVANVARVVGNNATPLQQAHSVAQLINIIGPDAARAFGPKMRQLSYRYAGQEALPSQFSDVARGGKQTDAKGVEETTEAFERRLEVDLAGSLPTATEYKAALQAGTTPPSKGYLLDKNGTVVTESVGFADDWYTPFNLKRLPKLKHGSYVRTRGYGGITPEDIQLANHTGATRVTVVSNSGVFSLELDDRARNFGHRFGFGGTAMQRRYAKSLDGITNGRVANPQSPDRALKLDHLGYKTALKDLKNKYPYFITKVRADPPINTSAKIKDDNDALVTPGTPNEFEDDKGYIKPLSIKASGAQYGYAETSVLSPANRGAEGEQHYVKGKVAYDQLDRYRLARSGDVLATAVTVGAAATGARPAGGNGNGGNGNGGGGARPTARTDAPVAGGAMQDPAYNPPGERIEAKEATRMLDDAKAMFVAHPDIEIDDPGLDDIREVLLNGEKGKGEWTNLHRKLMSTAGFRDALRTALSDNYGETTTGQKLLPGWEGLAAADPFDEEEVGEQDVDDPFGIGLDGFYHDASLLARASIESSPTVTNWINQKKGSEAPEAIKTVKDYEWYLGQMDRHQKRGDWAEYEKPPEQGGYNDASRKRFDDMHTTVTRMLNDDLDKERDRKLNPTVDQAPDTAGARRADADEQAARAPQGTVSFNFREALESPMPKNYAMDTVKHILNTTNDPEEIKAQIYRYQSAARTAAKAQPLDKDREKLQSIADEFGAAVKYWDME